jgi:hypothetical protein
MRNGISVMAQFLSQHDIGPGLRHLLRAAAADVAVVIAVEPVEQDIRFDAAPDVALATGESELSTTIRIQLSEVAEGADGARILTLPWTRPSPYRKREIIQGANDAKTYARPMPANARVAAVLARLMQRFDEFANGWAGFA